MLARRSAYLLGIAASVAVLPASAPARAAANRPIAVIIAGRGAIRFRLAAGVTAPCDSADNRMIFDDWLSPGRYSWTLGSPMVCYQHTSGAFREVDWSNPQIVSTVPPRGQREMEIRIATD